MKFDSGEQFAALCFTYAYKIGFQLHVRTSGLLDVYKGKGVRRNRVGEAEVQFHMMKKIRLGCSKGRKSNTNPEHVPCKVFVDGRIKFGGDKFVITQCDLYFKKRMMLNDRAGIPITRNFNTLVMEGGGYENLPFNYRDMRNAINQERRKCRFGGDAQELISYFDLLKRENPDFFFAVEKDVNEALLNIFWADARCRAMHKAFGDVWIECMGRAPSVMLTDQCKAMEGAIRKVFPHTKHRLCLWRILQNADKNLRSHPQFTAIDRDMRTLVHESTTEEEFENLWAEMVEKYSFQKNSWMDTFCAGMSSTQRSEQSNRYFKSFVSIETGLKQFIDQFEFALKRKAEEENVLNFAYKNRPLKWNQGILFEDVFHKVYTNKKFQEVKDEVYGCINTNMETLLIILGFVKMFRATSKVSDPFWKKERRSFDVSIDTVAGEYKCGCKLFEFKGIVCRHIIKCLDVLDVNVIPDKYILARWRKDLVRGYENIRAGYYDPGQSERVKKSVELTVRSDYMTTLTMHDDESYHIYMAKTNELIKTLEAHAGIENVNAFGEGDVSTRVWGRRRLQRREPARETARGEADIRDPPIGEGMEEGVCRGNQREEKQPRETPTRSLPRRRTTSLLKSAASLLHKCTDHN
ncbi:hypothetical protein RND81_03G066700 [Saponaria officinalis]|uniref:SWIM-type domain-containing protein n=1 Tax=Saponaria officinalis TaxID=3572 RepID=A0AAW1M1P6_SAPOF